MNRKSNVIAYAIFAALIASGIAQAAPETSLADETGWSADLPLAKPATSRTNMSLLPGTTASPSAADVGDADSFGRAVNWLGLAADSVELSSDCSSGATHCQILAPVPGTTTFDFPDIARIKLPRNASNSLLCYWFSPVLTVNYDNPTAAPVVASLHYFPSVTIENPVLADPALIDPSTGLPFGGSLLTAMTSTEHFEVPLPAGLSITERTRDSTVCIAGLISRDALINNYGLTAAQAREFFRKPTTLRLNIEGSSQYVGAATMYFGLRVVGD
jgi:hypothetical protein